MALGGIAVLPNVTLLQTFLLTSFRDAGEVTEDKEKWRSSVDTTAFFAFTFSVDKCW